MGSKTLFQLSITKSKQIEITLQNENHQKF